MSTLFLIVFIDLVGFGIIIPLLPFFALHFQADPFTVAMVMAVYSLAQFIAAPFWGRLSDRIGRKPVLVMTMLGASGAYVWMGFSETLVMLFAARILGGFMAGNIGTAFAYVADVTTPENRAKGMGVIGAAFGLGFIAGPAIGGILAGADPLNANYQAPAFAAAALSIVAAVMAMVFLKESLTPEERAEGAARPRRNRWAEFKSFSGRPTVNLLVGLSFLATFVFAGMETTFAMWSQLTFGWGPQQNGYLFAFVGVIAAIMQGGLVGRLTKRFGEANLIIQGAVALAIGMLLIPFSDSIEMLIAAMIIVAYGFSVINPALNSLISLQVERTRQGAVMGVTRSATTLARVAGPAFAGILFAQLGMDWPYFAGTALMLIVALFAIKARGANEDVKSSALEESEKTS